MRRGTVLLLIGGVALAALLLARRPAPSSSSAQSSPYYLDDLLSRIEKWLYPFETTVPIPDDIREGVARDRALAAGLNWPAGVGF